MRILMTAVVVAVVGLGGSAYAAPATQPAREFRPILSVEQKREAGRQLIDRFVAHVRAEPGIPVQAKAAVAEGWKKHRSDEDTEGFLQAGLAIISEPFKTGLTAMESEKYDAANEAFKTLVDAPDSYLSLNARALLARTLVEQERLEEAQTILDPLAAKEAELIDRTFLETEVDFLQSYCQLSNLHYDDALESLQRFEYEHPDAPDRFRLPAHQMLTELKARQPEHLGDISDLMVYSSRRLANGEPGKPVQVKQEEAITLLAKLIAEAEEREQQKKGGQGSKGCKECKGKGCSKCPGGTPKGANQPKSPANKSILPGGQGQIGELNRSPDAKPGDEWGKMRPEERERVLQSLRRTFPSRYRQLVEQYYKQLAKEK